MEKKKTIFFLCKDWLGSGHFGIRGCLQIRIYRDLKRFLMRFHWQSMKIICEAAYDRGD
ncbi:MAG: hypothetical protein L0207_06795 [Chlamydiae bacterium]|nr:hypothetical protein [Chlamydiota bacterium]